MLDLLVLDESNPRSILFQLDGIVHGLGKLTLTYGNFGGQLMAPLMAELQALTAATDLYCGNAQLIDLMFRIKVASDTLSEQIGVRFFSHTAPHGPED